jgi:hypothetical protein
MEKVAHGVYEPDCGLSTFEGCVETFRKERELEPVFIAIGPHALEPLGKDLGIAIFATRGNLRAASHRVPSMVRPFDL